MNWAPKLNAGDKLEQEIFRTTMPYGCHASFESHKVYAVSYGCLTTVMQFVSMAELTHQRLAKACKFFRPNTARHVRLSYYHPRVVLRVLKYLRFRQQSGCDWPSSENHTTKRIERALANRRIDLRKCGPPWPESYI